MVNQRFLVGLTLVGAMLSTWAGAMAAESAVLTVRDVREQPEEWYATSEGQAVIDAIIAAQVDSGGWRKGYNLLEAPGANRPQAHWAMGTFDNGATHTELRLLAKAYRRTGRQDALRAFSRGLDFIFASQYPNGGWPQRWPVPNDDDDDYAGYITLNDHAMNQVMKLLHDVAMDAAFDFVDAPRRERARAAFDKGVACLLALQITVDGKLTGWAQQYDVQTLQPAKARAYELPAIASDESVGVLRVLMSVDDPSPEVRRAIHAGVAWLEASKVTGTRLVKTPDSSLPKGYDVKAVDDADAPVLWARYYEIETNRPFFCGRDGVKKYSMNEIEAERRSGYAWLRPYAQNMPQEYAQWKARVGER